MPTVETVEAGSSSPSGVPKGTDLLHERGQDHLPTWQHDTAPHDFLTWLYCALLHTRKNITDAIGLGDAWMRHNCPKLKT